MFRSLLSLFWIAPFFAFAGDIKTGICQELQSKKLYQVRADLVRVEPLCQKDTSCVNDGTVITLKFYMRGCLDTLDFNKNFNYEYRDIDRTLILDVQAFAHENPKSVGVKCFAPNTATKKVVLANKFDSKRDISLKNIAACDE